MGGISLGLSLVIHRRLQHIGITVLAWSQGIIFVDIPVKRTPEGLFEQDAERFRMREVSAPTGARDIVYIPPSVMMSLVADWGPCWTEAEFSGLVKVSASGWAPYLIMQQLFC